MHKKRIQGKCFRNTCFQILILSMHLKVLLRGRMRSDGVKKKTRFRTKQIRWKCSWKEKSRSVVAGEGRRSGTQSHLHAPSLGCFLASRRCERVFHFADWLDTHPRRKRVDLPGSPFRPFFVYFSCKKAVMMVSGRPRFGQRTGH